MLSFYKSWPVSQEDTDKSKTNWQGGTLHTSAVCCHTHILFTLLVTRQGCLIWYPGCLDHASHWPCKLHIVQTRSHPKSIKYVEAKVHPKICWFRWMTVALPRFNGKVWLWCRSDDWCFGYNFTRHNMTQNICLNKAQASEPQHSPFDQQLLDK